MREKNRRPPTLSKISESKRKKRATGQERIDKIMKKTKNQLKEDKRKRDWEIIMCELNKAIEKYGFLNLDDFDRHMIRVKTYENKWGVTVEQKYK